MIRLFYSTFLKILLENNDKKFSVVLCNVYTHLWDIHSEL